MSSLTRRQINERKNKTLRKKQAAVSRRKPERDPKYLDLVRTFPCIVCCPIPYPDLGPGRVMAATVQNGNGLVLAQQTTPTQACHMGPHGISQKASDYTAIPMCVAHHQQYGSRCPTSIDLPALQAKLREAYEAQRTC